MTDQNINNPATNSNACLDAALENARDGKKVFPAVPGVKMSYKAGRRYDGERWGATKDLAEIERDWARWPQANLGLPTDAQNGFFVVETDGPSHGDGIDGEAALAKLVKEHGELPETRVAVSPSGSKHYYFNWPRDGRVVRNSTGKLAKGIDVRGEGGMVLAPPSKRDGKFYEWLKNGPIADAPQWLLDIIALAEIVTPTENFSPAENLPCDGDIAEFVAHLPDSLADNCVDWRNFGLCLFALFNGNENGLKLFDWFSQKSPNLYNKPLSKTQRLTGE